MSKRATILAIAVAAIFVLLAVAKSCKPNDSNENDAQVDVSLEAMSDASVRVPDVEAVDAAWQPLPTDGSTFAALLGEQPVPATYQVGAPGRYPPAKVFGTSISLPHPTQTMSGEDVDFLEVLVQSDDGTHAFWGDLPTGAIAVELEPARDVRVRVLTAALRPQAGATVRLAREVVSLLPQIATTDEDGWATFATLPHGNYVASVGHLVVDVVGGEATVVTPPTVSVRGTVRTADGDPVGGATIAVYGAEVGTNPLGDLPVDVVTTDARGAYHVARVAGSEVAVVASSDDFPPVHVTHSATLLEDVVIDVVMRAGRSVEVRVMDEQGSTVANATVTWTDPMTHIAGSALTDAQGAATLRNVPPNAHLAAAMLGFASNVTHVANVNGGSVELILRRHDARKWRVRVEMPRDVALLDLQAYDAAGARCSVETADGRDFTLSQCGEGKLTLEVHTPHGIAVVSTPPRDGVTVDVPSPIAISLTFNGVDEQEWRETQVTARARNISQAVAVSRGAASARLYPGRWAIEVTNRRVGRVDTEIHVTAETTTHTVELGVPSRKTFHVVDAYGAPITGAYVMLFAGNDLVATARSAGELPTTFTRPTGFDGTILVVDSRRGEGTLRWSQNATRIDLTGDVLSNRIPTTRLTPAQLADALGTPVSAADRGQLIDPRPGSAAANAGLKRGDRVITAWREGSRVRVIAARGNTIIDVRL